MKKLIAFILSLCLIFSLSGCQAVKDKIDEILGFAPAKKEEEPVQTPEKEETASQEKTEPKKEDKNEENKAPEQPQLF